MNKKSWFERFKEEHKETLQIISGVLLFIGIGIAIVLSIYMSFMHKYNNSQRQVDNYTQIMNQNGYDVYTAYDLDGNPKFTIVPTEAATTEAETITAVTTEAVTESTVVMAETTVAEDRDLTMNDLYTIEDEKVKNIVDAIIAGEILTQEEAIARLNAEEYDSRQVSILEPALQELIGYWNDRRK